MLLGTKRGRERTGDKKGANRGQKGNEPGTTKRERTGDKKGANRGQKGNELSTKGERKSTAVIHILGFRCFFFFAYKYLYTCLAGTPRSALLPQGLRSHSPT
ncbi:hypothetical protein BLNIAS_P100010 (plasmid) [Bifidobacterium longum subsp. longum KACC 91563]|nr:hypothetical protein BLNIAS_P100010 [Bifidobacterium longum subsp. longum KACC 91563]